MSLDDLLSSARQQAAARSTRGGGMEVFNARCLREVEQENRRLKKLVAEQGLDFKALKPVV